MAGAPLQVRGSRELKKALADAGVDVVADVKATHRKVGGIVLSKALTLVPVKSGQLQSSIRVGVTQSAGIVRAGRARVPYANPIHWGWHKRHIKPTLFLTRAAKDTEPAWVNEYYKAFDEILDKIRNSTDGVTP